jgi:hypothetical protein
MSTRYSGRGRAFILKGQRMIKLIDMDKVKTSLTMVAFNDATMLERILGIINNATANVDMSERMISLCEGEKIHALDTVIDIPTMDDENKSLFEHIANCWIGDYYDGSTTPVFRKTENFF